MLKIFKIVGVMNYLFVVFLNAFTDLGHKIIIQNTIFKVYDGETQIVLTAIVNALILLPFILIFSPSGFLADRFAKNNIMKYSAFFAIIITILITFSYYNGWFYTAFGLTFLLALQSAIYGPAKYGYIRELFGVENISAANGAVQAVTTVAILSGIIFYSVLFENLVGNTSSTQEEVLQIIAPLGFLLILGSIIEFIVALKLPNKKTYSSQKVFQISKYLRGEYLYKNLKIVSRKKEIVSSIMALSLFWSISQVILAIFGEYAKSNLAITNAATVQGIMALAVIGIVFGSLLAAKFCKYYIDMGLVSVGALGISLIIFTVPWVSSVVVLSILFTFFGVFSGFILVPLNAKIQFLSPRVHLGTIMAGNNFIQNIFMVSFLVLTTVFAYFGMNSQTLFFLMVCVGIYLTYMVYKEYSVMSFGALMRLIASLRHTYTFKGLDTIPHSGGVLLLGNHISWLDWIIIQIPIERPINYMMEKDIYHWRGYHYVFKVGEAIPISPKASKDAFKEAHRRLMRSKIVGIFPEGRISEDGEIGKFFKGYELIDKDYDGVIVPFYIEGLFGSLFSRYKLDPRKSFFRRRKVTVHYGKPLPKETTAEELKEIIQNMKEESAQ
ncbi:MAG: MFS transporter [Sulfurimonas sp.]|nr:MFS transporter [Sulfurimonas sp.]PHQ92409.1 MAG: MFS transporter [Sulfurimonas sp.]